MAFVSDSKKHCENSVITFSINRKTFVTVREISDIMQFLMNKATNYRELEQLTCTVLEYDYAQNRYEVVDQLQNSYYFEMNPLPFTPFTHFTTLISINTRVS
jgi:hypothetical protein